jgi:UDP-3-O-[3-hydroxymyristoyl] glucosamine N-acyltransferase
MKLTLEEIISLTGGKLISNESSFSSLEVQGMAALNEAGSDEVSFLGNEKYYQDYLETKAGVVLIPADVPGSPDGACLIEVENPSVAFGEVIKHFVKAQTSFTPGVHPAAYVAEDVSFDPTKVSIKAGAIVEAGVVIGNGTEIGAGTVVCHHVSIGENCLLHANCTVRERCVLNDRVILQPGCVIGSDGYGFALVDGRHEKIDQVGIVVLEEDVEIGASSTIDRARFGKTIIGEGTKIDNQVQIGHNVRMGKHCLMVSQVGISGSTIIGNYVTMAGQAGAAGHLKIGDNAVLTGRTGAIKDLPGDTVYMGMPARPIREELKKQANLARLPKLIKEVKELKKKLEG